MPYIFRIQKDGASDMTVQDWSDNAKRIDDQMLKFVKDDIGKGGAKIGTSIPSPFARLHLFKTAFALVNQTNDQGNLAHEGNSPYHQLVSDCLDLLQLIFSGGIDAQKLTYTRWTRNERLAALQSKPVGHPHRLLGDTLRRFLDEKEFTGMNDITLIYYQGMLVGGTSPFTLFFTSPNWRRMVVERNLKLTMDASDDLFDDDLKALHQRDPQFQAFLYKLVKANPTFFENAKEFRDYILKSGEYYRGLEYTNQFSSFQNNSTALEMEGSGYEPVKLGGDSITYLQIGALKYLQLKAEDQKAKIQRESDFVIDATVETYKQEFSESGAVQTVYKPLVLMKGMNLPGEYVGGAWNPDAPFMENAFLPLTTRILPDVQINYPWISISDFLTETLVVLPYQVSKDSFLNGFNINGRFNYLLPIKKDYFKFFTLKDLKDNLRITVTAEKVEVVLRVPIVGPKIGKRFMEFYRAYSLAQNVMRTELGLGIFPSYQIQDPEPALQALNEYNVMLVDSLSKPVEQLNFYTFVQPSLPIGLANARPEPRMKDSGRAASFYYKVPQRFDFVEFKFSNGVVSGLAIPAFVEVRHNADSHEEFHFAIDFGTSNTHVAYTNRANPTPQSFSITSKERQVLLLSEPGQGIFADEHTVIKEEFVPQTVGESATDVSFPFRTATCEKPSFDNTVGFDLFSNVNIGFALEASIFSANRYTTNLKWSFENESGSKGILAADKVEAFLYQLMLLIRNKVILNKGKLSLTKVAWTLPLSMSGKGKLVKKFEEAFDAAFKQSGAVREPRPITESIAPYHFLAKQQGGRAVIESGQNTINMDIGGGTTDVMMYMTEQNAYVSTSFKFAGNDLWGGGYKRGAKDNGFIKNFQQIRSNLGGMPGNIALDSYLNDAQFSAEDIVNLMFRHNDVLRFTDSIKQGNSNLLFTMFVHYSAIIYHTVEMLTEKNLPLPRYLTFTGKGSQYLKLLFGAEYSLEEYTKLLFKAYTDKPVRSDFRCILVGSPKEVTASGAVLTLSTGETSNINPETSYRLGNDANYTQPTGGYDQQQICNTPFVSNDFRVSVLTNLQSFFTKTFRNGEISRFIRDEGGVALNKFSSALDSPDFVNSGIFWDSYNRVMDDTKNNNLSETFFFYALKDALYQLSKMAL